MQVDVTSSGLHPPCEALLKRVHFTDQGGEIPVVGAMGSGDVGGVAVAVGPGVDQEASRLVRRRRLSVLVVQNRTVLVEPDDAVVRQRIRLVSGTTRRRRHSLPARPSSKSTWPTSRPEANAC